MAALVGLKVQPVGPKHEWFQGLIVCILPGRSSDLLEDFDKSKYD